jgi:hypothetical protein
MNERARFNGNWQNLPCSSLWRDLELKRWVRFLLQTPEEELAVLFVEKTFRNFSLGLRP